MRKFVLILTVFVCFPAFAQDSGSTITIIHEDGSKDVIDLTQPAEASEPDIVPEAVVEKAPEVIVPVEEGRPLPKIETASAVQPKPVSKPKAQAKKRKAVSKPENAVVVPPKKPVRQTIPQGAEITPRRAQYIALEAAPPSRDMKVFLKDYEGREVYAVLFELEDGFFEVLVDQQSGQILGSGISEDIQKLQGPGYLPQTLN